MPQVFRDNNITYIGFTGGGIPKADFADNYSTSKAYKQGELCWYSDQLYRANRDMGAGSWNSSLWTAVNISDVSKTATDAEIYTFPKDAEGNLAIPTADWFEFGTINSSNGNESYSDTRIRTRFIHANKGDEIQWRANKVILYFYNEKTKAFESSYTLTSRYNSYTVTNDCYMKVVLGYSNDATITDKFDLTNNFVITRNIKKPILTIPECSTYDIWGPDHTTDIYKTDKSWNNTFCSIGYNDLIKTYYDKWLNETNDYSVIKTALGFDASNKYQLFEFDFCPKGYTRTVLLSAGMNGVEISTIFGLAYFIENLFTSNDPGMKWLHDNVRFKVIPVINPYSFEMCQFGYGATGLDKYLNYNGVNINRNFNYNGEWYDIPEVSPHTWGYKGAAPDSEPETKILINWIKENRKVAAYWMDCHSDVTGTTTRTFAVYCSDNYTAQRIMAAQEGIKDYYTAKGLSPSNPSAAVITSGSTYPKHPYFYNYYGVRNFMMEQDYTVGTGYGATGYNGDEASITNYVISIRAYALAMLQAPEQHYYQEDIFGMLCSMKTKDIGNITDPTKYTFDHYAVSDGNYTYYDSTKATSDFIAFGTNGQTRIELKSPYRLVACVVYDRQYNMISYTALNTRIYGFTKSSTARFFKLIIQNDSGTEIDVNDLTYNNVMIALDYVDKYSQYEYGRYINVSGTGATIDRVYNRAISPYFPLTKDLKRVFIRRMNTNFVPVDFVSYSSIGTVVGNNQSMTYVEAEDGWVVGFREGTKYFRFSTKLSDNSNNNINLVDLDNSFKIEDYNG